MLTGAIIWSISGPLQFNKERDKRYVDVIAQLQDIGYLQKEFNNQTGRFAYTIDSLISFADTATYVIVERKDTTIYQRNAQGINIPKDITLTRELGRVKVKDSIFKGRDYKKLGVKNVGDRKPYHMDVKKDIKLNEDSTAYITNYFFKAYASKNEILDGLNKNFITNEIAEGKVIQDTVLSVGSLILSSTVGNWSPEQDMEARELKQEQINRTQN